MNITRQFRLDALAADGTAPIQLVVRVVSSTLQLLRQ